MGCFEELMNLYAMPRQKGRIFHLGKYRDAIERFQTYSPPSKLLDVEAEGPEEFLALYEAYAKSLGNETLQDKVIANALTDRQKNRIRMVEKFYKKSPRPLDTFSVRKLSEDFYVLGKVPNAGFLRRMLERWKYTISYSKAFQYRMSLDMTSHGLEQAFINSGNLKTLDEVNRFRRWRKKHPNIEQTIIALAFYSYRLYQASLPVLLPGYSMAAAKIIPKEVSQRILDKGFQEAIPHLKKMYDRSVYFNQAFEMASMFYTSAMIIYFGYHIMHSYDGISFLLGFELTGKETLSKLQEETFDAMKVRLEQLENWKESIRLFESREPTTEEIEKKWEEIELISDEDLKVNYAPPPSSP